MATFKIERRHDLDPESARARIGALGDYLQNKYGLNVSWNGDTASITGRYLVATIEGTVKLSPGIVTFEGKDPGMLWRGKAKEYLDRKLSRYLDAGTRIEDLPRS